MNHPPTTDTVRVAAMCCLTVVVVSAVAGLTVVAVMTDRDLWPAEVLTFAAALLVAVLGGLTVRRRWGVDARTNGDQG